MRGKVWDILQPLADWGITPACAGKSCLAAIYAYNEGDHPRVCGEKRANLSIRQSNQGSPPRVRGKVLPRLLFLACIGITPACAGKRGHGRQSGRSAGDHPRVCGEKVCKEIAPLSVWGSPPRVRGKVLAALMPENRVGITPACAGKSCCCYAAQVCRQDHPRVCGEKRVTLSRWTQRQGSPPRVRGKESTGQLLWCMIGITPACAGKRLKRSHSIGHFSCILCLFHSVLHRASVSGGSRAGPCAPPCLPAQNAVPV